MRTSLFRHGAQALQAIPMSAVIYDKLLHFMACTFRQVPDRADALS